MKEIVLGGGCFWCVESAFKEVEGIEETECGYAGGHTDDPSYREVCRGKTGHAEVVRIVYNDSNLELEDVLELFFRIHDPTTKDRQGPDVGSQYRSIILYQNDDQREEVQSFIEEKEQDIPGIVTEVEELEHFYPAEDKHQNYFEKNPDDAYCRINIPGKQKKAREFSSERS